MSKFRKPTKDEEINAWRKLAWDLSFHRTVSMNKPEVEAILKRTDAYVEAHNTSNGLKADPEVNQNVWEAFWTHIHGIAIDGVKGAKKGSV